MTQLYKICPTCGKRLWKTRNHRCIVRTQLRIKFTTGQFPRGHTPTIRHLIKDEYVGKIFNIDARNRSAIVRLFMDAMKNCEPNDFGKAKAITWFLRRFHLTRAEVHAILFHTGFRYSITGSHGAASNMRLRNIKIGGYHNHRK